MKRLSAILLGLILWLALPQPGFASFTVKGGVAAIGASNTASDTYAGTAVSTGDLIIAFCIWDDATHALTSSFSDTASTYVKGTQTSGTGAYTGQNVAFYYSLSSAASGTPTYTLTVTGATALTILVYVFTVSATPTFDVEAANAVVTDTAVSTGSLVTTGSDELIFAGAAAQNDATPVTAQAIGGTSATTSQSSFFTGQGSTIAAWFLAKTGTNSGTATLNSTQAFVAAGISFKITGGGGGGLAPQGAMTGVGK